MLKGKIMIMQGPQGLNQALTRMEDRTTQGAGLVNPWQREILESRRPNSRSTVQESSPQDLALRAKYRANVAAAKFAMGIGSIKSADVNSLNDQAQTAQEHAVNHADLKRRVDGGNAAIMDDVKAVATQVAENGNPELGGTMMISVSDFLDRAARV